MSRHIERAVLLYEQDRNDQAAKELRQALAADPDNALAHSLLALCLSDMEQYQEATREARHGVHLEPDSRFSHYALAYVLCDRERLEEARRAIQEAIRLDPDDAQNFGLLAGIEYKSRDWPKALEAAEMGLRLDPEEVACTNIQAMALVNLGRKAEAGRTIDAALQRDPENPVVHANMGWTLLHRGEPRQAMEHFREALRLDPGMEWARAGIIEAMKARNFIYRWLLAYFLWMTRLSHKAQWGVIIGLYVGYRLLRGLARSNPELAPYLYPLLAAYLIFGLLTWIGEPLFNLLLRLNRFGRLALSPNEIKGANWLAICLGGAILSGIACWWFRDPVLLALAVFSGLMAMPVAATFRRPPGWPRKFLSIYTLALAAVGMGGILTLWIASRQAGPETGERLFTIFGVVFLLGWILFQWVANAVAMARVRR